MNTGSGLGIVFGTVLALVTTVGCDTKPEFIESGTPLLEQVGAHAEIETTTVFYTGFLFKVFPGYYYPELHDDKIIVRDDMPPYPYESTLILSEDYSMEVRLFASEPIVRSNDIRLLHGRLYIEIGPVNSSVSVILEEKRKVGDRIYQSGVIVGRDRQMMFEISTISDGSESTDHFLFTEEISKFLMSSHEMMVESVEPESE